tara:strand:+ start:1043 stop:1696 length:654 start_codon:yes stop_codon:yes gene_type:complete
MMMGEVVAVRPGRGRMKTRVGVWDLLQWAFQRELAGIDFDEIATMVGQSVIGGTYLMMQHGALGCRVDGGGRSPCHPDADIVAATLGCLPDRLGGRRMAVMIAEMARAGLVPDWMPDARPRIEAAEWGWNPHGRHAKTERVGTAHVIRRGVAREVEVRCCPVVWIAPEREIERARRHYMAWWLALLDVQMTLRMSRDLSAFEVTDAMPPRCPWKENT